MSVCAIEIHMQTQKPVRHTEASVHCFEGKVPERFTMLQTFTSL